MKKAIVFLVLLTSSMISGLLTTERIVDDIFMVMIVGYDYVDEHLFTGTVVAPLYKADDTIENMAYSDTSSLIYENRDKLEAKSQSPLISGKLEVALYNRELAEHGIFPYIDNLQRDPNIGSRIYLAVFDGSTEKVLHKQYKDQPTGVYVSELIEQNSKFDNLPITNLHTFGFQYFAKGLDPTLPLLEEENEKIYIKGLALFKDDKMVADVPKKDFIYFRSLYEHFKNGVLFIKLNTNERAFLTNIKSRRKFMVENSGKQFNPDVTISIKMKGVLKEYTGKEIDSTVINNIEQQIKQDVETKMRKMIDEYQAKGIDPIGIGHHVRNYSRNWDEQKWQDIYPTLNVKINADFTILEHGVVK